MTDKMIPVPRELLEELRDCANDCYSYESTLSYSRSTRVNFYEDLVEQCDDLLRAPAKEAVTPAVRDVLAERQRQISAEGWTPEHDDEHDTEEMAFAAACYLTADEGDEPPAVWPWDMSWWKPKDRRRNLVKAGALIIAEIERLDRAENPSPAAHTDNEGDLLPLSCPMADQSNCAMFGTRPDPLAQWTREFSAKQEPLGVNLGDMSSYYETDDRPPADQGEPLPSKPDDLEAMRRDAEYLYAIRERDELLAALKDAREYVDQVLTERKAALAGYPNKWRGEQDDLDRIDALIASMEEGK